MTTPIQDTVTYIVQDNVCAWIAFNAQRQSWSAESMVRVAGGIRYRDLEYGSQQPTLDVLRSASLRGFFSHRPFKLGRALDPTMTHCVLGLFGHFCAARNFDPQHLLKQAYPTEPYRYERNFREIAAQAEWEGIVYPQLWTARQIDELVFALSEVCYEALADLLEERTRIGTMNTISTPRFPDAHVQLSGEDGNVFAIIGRVRRALLDAGATDEDARSFMDEAMHAGSYEQVLHIAMQWADVS